MDRFHERDVGVNRLFVRSPGIWNQRNRTHRTLDGVQQGQTGEHAVRHVLFIFVQSFPRGNIVRQRDLFGKPEIAGQTIPHLQIFVIFDVVPVDGLHGFWNPNDHEFLLEFNSFFGFAQSVKYRAKLTFPVYPVGPRFQFRIQKNRRAARVETGIS